MITQSNRGSLDLGFTTQFPESWPPRALISMEPLSRFLSGSPRPRINYYSPITFPTTGPQTNFVATHPAIGLPRLLARRCRAACDGLLMRMRRSGYDLYSLRDVGIL